VSKRGKVADKLAGKTKQIVAEVIGDGKLSDEGKRQERIAKAKAEEGEGEGEDKANLSKITNNLT
jgi:uncharacterized protein YjbJ (UPF0337 family)